ncbi:MAG: thioredoxin [Limnochordia bacterium]
MRRYAQLIALRFFLLIVIATGVESATVDVHFFWGDGCTVCAKEHLFLAELQERYGEALEIHDYEIWYHPELKPLLFEMAAERGVEVDAVPVTFIGERAWIGFDEAAGEEMITTIEATMAGEPVEATSPSAVVRLPFGREVDLRKHSLIWATVVIGLVDGMNPCSLWMLSLLLAMIMRSGSRARIILVGVTFLFVTAAIYSLFVAGLFSVFSYVGYLRWVQVGAAMVALVMGVLNIKDYAAFGVGPSLAISKENRPRIYQGIRDIMAERSPVMAFGATAVLAAAVALMELPCTAGFPMVWSSLLSSQGVSKTGFILLLSLYMGLYLLDELIVFGAAAATLRATRMQEKHGRLLKLGGGSLMLAFAGALLIEPEILNDLSGTLIVCAVAAALAVTVAAVFGRGRRGDQMRP